MKTLINIGEDEIYQLDEFSKQKGVSRSHLIREAIAQFIVNESEPVEDVFGLFKKKNYKRIKGLKYQADLRSEW